MYLPRIMDSILEKHLGFSGAVLIQGPKWCGKTTTAERASNSVLKLQDPDKARMYAKMVDVMPSRLLEGKTPRLVDEWQTAPILWDAVRSEVDKRGEPGQFILTGSSVVDESSIMHSGIGRISRVDMRTMSLYESQESNGAVSLRSLFKDGKSCVAESELSIDDIAYAICRGGWPASVSMARSPSLMVARSYLDGICETDASRVDGISKRPDRVRALLRSYARNISTQATNRTVLRDIIQNDVEMTETTMYAYLSALRQLYVIEDIPAWNPALRSATSMRSLNKKGFTDPSIASAALDLEPETLIWDPETFEFLFESLCIRDLRVYSSDMGGSLSYYQDRYGLECDAVLHLRNGDYALIEIKLGDKGAEEGASNLVTMRNLISENGMRAPSFLMVITGGSYAYERDDGVNIVPIGCLKD